jgi:hypothetical protein
MTMEQEWARNDTWCDHNQKEFSGWEEYQYVLGLAVSGLKQEDQDAGVRDKVPAPSFYYSDLAQPNATHLPLAFVRQDARGLER